jgi:hypothetical protein
MPAKHAVIRLLGRLTPLLALLAFAPAAGGELTPLGISPSGSSGSAPRIAADGRGNVVAVWRELDGNDSAIRAAFKPQGGDWEASRRISRPGPETESPHVAMDRQGNGAAVWNRSSNGHDDVVQAAVRPADGQWSAPQDLSTPGAIAFGANVAAAAGDVTAVWIELQNRHTAVMSSSRTVAGEWTRPTKISGQAGNTFGPVVAMDDDGGAVAAWQWFDGAFLVVQAAVRDAGAWSKPETLAIPGRSTSRPQLVMDAKGNAIAGWIRSNGAYPTAQVAYRPANGAWGQPTNLSNRGGKTSELDLAMNRKGDAVALWNQRSGRYGNLWSSSRPAEGHWGPRTEVTDRWLGLRARIALDQEGNATAVWTGSATISASFKPAGDPWQSNYLLSGWDANAVQPVVETQSARNATAVWVALEDPDDDLIQSVSYDIDTAANEEAAAEADDESDDEGDDTSDDEGDDADEDSGGDGEMFVGTAGPDTLVGTPGNDVFYGRGGDDLIDGRGGGDVIYGGPGDDRTFGGDGRDRIFGGPGRDRIAAGRGRDVLLGGAGADRLDGGRGSDRLIGEAGPDRLAGGRGNDLLFGGAGVDTLLGNAGNDVLLAKDRRHDLALGGRGFDYYRLDRWLDRARSIESRYEN